MADLKIADLSTATLVGTAEFAWDDVGQADTRKQSVTNLSTFVLQQTASNVNITGGSIAGITDLAIADGGTGASTAAGARTNLGLGTAAVADTGTGSGNVPAFTGSAELNILANSGLLSEITTPTNPTANNLKVYAKDDGGVTKLAVLDSAGTETILGAGGGGGATNLAFANRTATQYDITSDTGTDATVTGATGTLAGAMVAADKSKLDGIASGATNNTGALADLDTVGTAQIDNDSVTLAKVQNAVANDKLLGSGNAGAGADYVELTLGTNLSISGTTLNATAGAGGYATIQEEGVGLTARTTMNFIGSAITAVDNAGQSRTDITVDAISASSTDTLTNKTFDANGTGNSISNIDVADLADGTDGSIITWDNTGAPTIITPGAPSQALFGNGGGIEPTYKYLGEVSVGNSLGQNILTYTTSGAPVNYLDIANANTGNAVAISALGSDANIDLDLQSKGTGDVTVNGNAIKLAGKQTIWLPATSMTSAAINGASQSSLVTTTNAVNMTTLDFDDTIDEYGHFNISFPKSWDEGTVTFQVYWSTDADTSTNGVAWALQAVSLSDSDPFDTAYGTAITVVDNNQSAAKDSLISSESTAVTVAGTPAEGDNVQFRIFRDVSNGSDNLVGDAKLVGIKVFYTDNAANDA